jgi:hypothetical protein
MFSREHRASEELLHCTAATILDEKYFKFGGREREQF